MDPLTFIMEAEDGSMSQEYFLENVQEFVNTGIWKHLQGSWQRMVHSWAENGYCVITSKD